MRFARLCILVFFTALVCSSASYSAVLLTASHSIGANAKDFSCCPAILPLGGKGDLKVGGVLNDSSLQPLLFEPHAEAVHGESIASLHATARAEVGSIGVAFLGGVATNLLGGGSIQAIHVQAGWHDGLVVRSQSRPSGTPLVFNVLMNIDGEMNANVSTPSPFPAGQAHAFLEVFEESPNFSIPASPYPGGIWAQLIEEPHDNKHINDVAPQVSALGTL